MKATLYSKLTCLAILFSLEMINEFLSHNTSQISSVVLCLELAMVAAVSSMFSSADLVIDGKKAERKAALDRHLPLVQRPGQRKVSKS